VAISILILEWGHNPAQHNNSSLAQHKKQEILKWCRTLYARKCAKLEENPVPGTRDESKIRLRKTHSHTSNRRGDKAEKERQDKGQERRPILKGRENCQRKPPPCHQQGGAGRACTDQNNNKRATATYQGREGGAKMDVDRSNTKNNSPVPQYEYPTDPDRPRF